MFYDIIYAIIYAIIYVIIYVMMSLIFIYLHERIPEHSQHKRRKIRCFAVMLTNI